MHNPLHNESFLCFLVVYNNDPWIEAHERKARRANAGYLELEVMICKNADVIEDL